MAFKTITVKTESAQQLVDITQQVRLVVRESGVKSGVCRIFIPHTTAGVTINENADADVVHDVLAALEKAVPWEEEFYQHGEGNSAAHVKASMVGSSVQVPVEGGRLALGMWQGIYFCEFDGARSRTVVVVVTAG